MTALGGGAGDVLKEVRVFRWRCGRGGVGWVGPLEGRGGGGGAFVLGLDESAKGVMAVNDVLLGSGRQCVCLRMIGFEVGGIKGAV